MKSKLILTIIFLFVSPYYALFAAHELGSQLSLYTARSGSDSQSPFAEQASKRQRLLDRASDGFQFAARESKKRLRREDDGQDDSFQLLSPAVRKSKK